jgi:hypothetical protein
MRCRRRRPERGRHPLHGVDADIHVAKLELGQAANVQSVDLVRERILEEGVSSGNVCFGYRDTEQNWHWDGGVTAVVYEASSDTFHAHIPINEGPIDGLVINSDWGSRVVKTLSYVVAPQ